MIRLTLAALAALSLSACGQGSGPALPRVQEGAQAPATLSPQPGARQAQIDDATREQLIANIDQMLDEMQQRSGGQPMQGFTDEVVPMQPGTDHRQLVSLTAGAAYMVVGACDGDCTNYDIELIDMRTGGVVASDVLPDDFPVVTFSPPANGEYMVRSMMLACSVAPCYAGTRVLTGPAPAGPGSK